MCGLFGFSGVNAPDRNKLNLIGIWNQNRGTDSCGVFSGGEVIKGIGTESRFSIFIQKQKIPIGGDNNTVIAHTRKASVGVINKDSAHPYTYYNDNNKPEFVFAHNGTVRNYEKYLKPYNIDPKIFHTDSHALGFLVANGYYDFLKDYDGAVTFIASDLKRPNSLIVFKGQTYKNEDADRPLFSLQTKEGLYVSSMDEPFEVIKEKGDVITNLSTNKIFFFKDGQLEETIDVDRQLITKKQKTYSTNYSGGGTSSSRSKSKGERWDENNLNHRKYTFNQKEFKGKVYWSNGRYWRNGHLAEGCLRLTDDGTMDSNGTDYYFCRGMILKASTFKEYLVSKGYIDSYFNSKTGKLNINPGYEMREQISKHTCEPFDFLDKEIPNDINYKSGFAYIGNKYATGTYLTMFANPKYIQYYVGAIREFGDSESKKPTDIIKNNSSQKPDYSKAVKNLREKSDDWWKNIQWESIKFEIMPEEIREVYWEKAKKFKKDFYEVIEEDDEQTQFTENDVNVFVNERITRAMDFLEILVYEMKEDCPGTNAISGMFTHWMKDAFRDLQFLELNSMLKEDEQLG